MLVDPTKEKGWKRNPNMKSLMVWTDRVDSTGHLVTDTHSYSRHSTSLTLDSILTKII